ncbi:MAG: glycosyltransferase family 39 protein [Candidatus Omnitrophica bacterium]|nr:glycosyltransferase family 39 protein [Candidatus Omnitrophota bacterium]
MRGLAERLNDNYLLFVLLGLASILIFAYSWVPGGLDVDSCNYAVVAKDILYTNKWLNLYDPIYEGPFYYHFPLCIWVTALLFKSLGITTFAAKLFSMACGLVLVATIYYFGKLLKDKWVGFFAGISLLLTNHIVRLSRQCRMDIPVTLFITLAMLSFFLAQRRRRAYYLLFGLFTCLAIFAKDIFGVFALAIALGYLVLRLRFKEIFHPLFLSGIVIALLPVLIWRKLDNNMLFGNWYSANFMHLWKNIVIEVPWYYYIWAIVTKYAYLLPFALYGGYLAVREAARNRNYEVYILLIWIAIFPLAFSFGRHKLHYFILPIYPAAALLAGWAFEAIFKERAKERIAATCKYIFIFSAVVMLCLPLDIRSKRFAQTVRLGPFINQIRKQMPLHEFIVYREDKSALLFYAYEIKRSRSIDDKKVFEDMLKAKDKSYLCYLSQGSFEELDSLSKLNSRIVLRYKDKIVLATPKNTDLPVALPE